MQARSRAERADVVSDRVRAAPVQTSEVSTSRAQRHAVGVAAPAGGRASRRRRRRWRRGPGGPSTAAATWCGDRQVVEAHDGDVVGHTQAGLVDRLQTHRRPSCRCTAKTAVRAVGEQPAHRLVAGVDREPAALDEARAPPRMPRRYSAPFVARRGGPGRRLRSAGPRMMATRSAAAGDEVVDGRSGARLVGHLDAGRRRCVSGVGRPARRDADRRRDPRPTARRGRPRRPRRRRRVPPRKPARNALLGSVVRPSTASTRGPLRRRHRPRPRAGGPRRAP